MGIAWFVFVFLLLLAFWNTSCTAQIHLKYRWDKNPEPDMSHYDLFKLILPDSNAFYSLTEWPADTSVQNVFMDSTIHLSHMIASIAHIYSPVDSMIYEFDQKQEQGYLRAYIIAIDSVGNKSAFGTSINIVYIGDREAPRIPGTYEVLKFPK